MRAVLHSAGQHPAPGSKSEAISQGISRELAVLFSGEDTILQKGRGNRKIAEIAYSELAKLGGLTRSLFSPGMAAKGMLIVFQGARTSTSMIVGGRVSDLRHRLHVGQ